MAAFKSPPGFPFTPNDSFGSTPKSARPTPTSFDGTTATTATTTTTTTRRDEERKKSEREQVKTKEKNGEKEKKKTPPGAKVVRRFVRTTLAARRRRRHRRFHYASRNKRRTAFDQPEDRRRPHLDGDVIDAELLDVESGFQSVAPTKHGPATTDGNDNRVFNKTGTHRQAEARQQQVMNLPGGFRSRAEGRGGGERPRAASPRALQPHPPHPLRPTVKTKTNQNPQKNRAKPGRQTRSPTRSPTKKKEGRRRRLRRRRNEKKATERRISLLSLKASVERKSTGCEGRTRQTIRLSTGPFHFFGAPPRHDPSVRHYGRSNLVVPSPKNSKSAPKPVKKPYQLDKYKDKSSRRCPKLEENDSNPLKPSKTQ